MNYAIDLSLKPTTFDLWHVCLAGTVALLALTLIVLLLVMVVSLARGKNKPAAQPVQQAAPVPEPVIKIVEKIVEVEKLVHAPAPEPVILKESTPMPPCNCWDCCKKKRVLSILLKKTSPATPMPI